MHRLPATCSIFAVLWCAICLAADTAGEIFPTQTQIAGQTLFLNGTGLRTRFGFKVYAAALYLPEPAQAEQNIPARATRRLEIRLLREFSANVFLDALKTGIRENSTPQQQEILLNRIQVFENSIQNIGTVKPGDRILFDYVVEHGTRLTINGKQQGGIIPGEDFAQAIFRIWLGDKPVDKNLKRSLLGLE